MRDLMNRPVARSRLTEITHNLRRAKERQLIQEFMQLPIARLPDGEVKEKLLDLRSRCRRYFDETV